MSNGIKILKFILGIIDRVILMSGSILAPWAITNHSTSSTAQLAKALRCSDAQSIGKCLKKKSPGEINAAVNCFTPLLCHWWVLFVCLSCSCSCSCSNVLRNCPIELKISLNVPLYPNSETFLGQIESSTTRPAAPWTETGTPVFWRFMLEKAPRVQPGKASRVVVWGLLLCFVGRRESSGSRNGACNTTLPNGTWDPTR